jgi:Na+/H+ antiporter NhaA
LELQTLSNTFNKFYESETTGGILLVICPITSLVCANLPVTSDYLNFWQKDLGGLSHELWVNDAIMAIFYSFIVRSTLKLEEPKRLLPSRRGGGSLSWGIYGSTGFAN